MPNAEALAPVALVDIADAIRVDATRVLDARRRGALGQFFTPASVATLLAAYSTVRGERVALLDPGAGNGMLTAAWVARACSEHPTPREIEVVAYEVDPALLPPLNQVLRACAQLAEHVGVRFRYEIRSVSFIQDAVRALCPHRDMSSEAPDWAPFDVVVMNPPYKKFRSDSEERVLLRELGIETGNLYTAFVSLALRTLRPGGELIAITPRSFCNGPYFAPFRKDLLSLASLTHLHVFDVRDAAFGEDDVLQENIVFRVERAMPQAEVSVDWSEAGDLAHTDRRVVPFAEVVQPGDKDQFLHIPSHDEGAHDAMFVRRLAGRLDDLGLKVSTGRVVDFRAKSFLRMNPTDGTVPLIYPLHFRDAGVSWPRPGAKKPNAILNDPEVADQINPIGVYVLVKRFTSKEETRRVVAAVFTPDVVPRAEFVAFENHLNYFHRAGTGLSASLAKGITAYLNSGVVDRYFRLFNGHTQVNAGDLNKLPYPTHAQLERIAVRLGDRAPIAGDDLDAIVESELEDAATLYTDMGKDRITEAVEILTALRLPKEQTNERAALTLLALLNLAPDQPWSSATNPLRGVTPIMEFVAKYYGKQWAPNTRETVRRFTLHQFQDAAVVLANPDKPTRPVNSPAYCYQVPASLLDVIREYGSPAWLSKLNQYLAAVPALRDVYARQREMSRIPLRLREGRGMTLSPGGQNELIAKIVHEFCPRFLPDSEVLYIGDADEKFAIFEEAALSALGVIVDVHGKMPDVVVHYTAKNWLVLIEAVTSHGPVSAKRHAELRRLFEGSSAPLLFVTAFLSRQGLNKYLHEIAWETEVWVADAPTHLIHFDGERFLGPYE